MVLFNFKLYFTICTSLTGETSKTFWLGSWTHRGTSTHLVTRTVRFQRNYEMKLLIMPLISSGNLVQYFVPIKRVINKISSSLNIDICYFLDFQNWKQVKTSGRCSPPINTVWVERWGRLEPRSGPAVRIADDWLLGKCFFNYNK
jgi:hypothetical protein